MRVLRVTMVALAVLGLWLAGAWAAEPAGPPKAQQADPEMRQALKAMRIGRLELIRERIGLQLLREKGAPQNEIEAAQGRVKALQERQHERLSQLRAKHPQAARRLSMMGKARMSGRTAPDRWRAPRRGMMGRGMAFGMERARPGAMGRGQGPAGRAGICPYCGGACPMGMGGRQQPGPMARRWRPMGPEMPRLREGMGPRPGPAPEPEPAE